MHKFLLIALILTVIAGAGLLIGQLWFDIMSWAVMGKALATLAILFVLIGFLLVVKSDFGQHKKMKDENYLD